MSRYQTVRYVSIASQILGLCGRKVCEKLQTVAKNSAQKELSKTLKHFHTGSYKDELQPVSAKNMF